MIPTFSLIYFYLNPRSNESSQIGFIILAIVLIIISICTFLFQKSQLHFEVFTSELSSEDFKKSVFITAKELDWIIIELTDYHAKIYRKAEYLGNGSERIIIKRINNKIFINSIANPEYRGSGYSKKRNKENVNAFLRNTRGIIKGDNVEAIIKARKKAVEDKFWESSEWTIKQIFKRIIGYGLTLFFVFLSLFLGLTYIKSDLKILSAKRQRRLTR